MGKREMFAGWGMYDHTAVCLTCKHQHLIAKGEQISAQPWLDWLTKHHGHETGIYPSGLLGQLGAKVASLAHNANVKAAYAASAAYTCTLASLANDATFLVGRQSDALSNAANLYLDELVAGKITAGTSPTAAKQIEVHAIGSLDDTPTYPDTFGAADAGVTITSADIKQTICAPLAIIGTSNTSNRAYPFRPVGLRQIFGDALPTAHALWVTHSTGVALHATAGNHVLKHTPVYATVT